MQYLNYQILFASQKGMSYIYLGLLVTGAIIVLLETVPFLDKHFIATITLVGIAFIYIGFAWSDLQSLVITISGVTVFLLLAYFGYKANFLWIVLGLVLHGVWDILYPYFGKNVPDGYDAFCITIDMLLAVYFYARLRPSRFQTNSGSNEI
jgi:hypothetical protein